MEARAKARFGFVTMHYKGAADHSDQLHRRPKIEKSTTPDRCEEARFIEEFSRAVGILALYLMRATEREIEKSAEWAMDDKRQAASSFDASSPSVPARWRESVGNK